MSTDHDEAEGSERQEDIPTMDFGGAALGPGVLVGRYIQAPTDSGGRWVAVRRTVLRALGGFEVVPLVGGIRPAAG